MSLSSARFLNFTTYYHCLRIAVPSLKSASNHARSSSSSLIPSSMQNSFLSRLPLQLQQLRFDCKHVRNIQFFFSYTSNVLGNCVVVNNNFIPTTSYFSVRFFKLSTAQSKSSSYVAVYYVSINDVAELLLFYGDETKTKDKTECAN